MFSFPIAFLLSCQGFSIIKGFYTQSLEKDPEKEKGPKVSPFTRYLLSWKSGLVFNESASPLEPAHG